MRATIKRLRIRMGRCQKFGLRSSSAAQPNKGRLINGRYMKYAELKERCQTIVIIIRRDDKIARSL